jgi:antitoxin MazE
MSDLRTIDKRGALALPLNVRAGIKHVEVVKRPDGVIELRPKVLIDQDQGWFWTDEWQAREREVDIEVAAGRVQSFESGEAFLAALDARAKP